VWDILNVGLNAAFGALFGVFGWLPFWVPVVVLGGLSGVGALLVFRRVSDQDAIRRAKNRIWAHLMELRLFQDDFGVMLRAQGNVFRYNLIYVVRALTPALVLFAPFALALIQIESRAVFRPVLPGEDVLLRVRLDAEPPAAWDARLETDLGLRVATEALRKRRPAEVLWRLHAETAGVHRVRVELPGVAAGVWEREVVVGADARHALAASAYRSGDWRALLAPTEASLGDGPIAEIVVEYPSAGETFAGLSASSWLFVASSLAVGFALRGPLGVEL